MSGGCAKFATSDKEITAIKEKVSIDMTESEFTASVSNVQLIPTTGDKILMRLESIHPFSFADRSRALCVALYPTRPNLHSKIVSWFLLTDF